MDLDANILRLLVDLVGASAEIRGVQRYTTKNARGAVFERYGVSAHAYMAANAA